MLYVNPLNMFNSMCPLSILAANLSPRETFLAKYEINSINTNKGSNPNGHPAGTNKEKNFNPCSLKPKTVIHNSRVKLSEIVKIKSLVLSCEYSPHALGASQIIVLMSKE